MSFFTTCPVPIFVANKIIMRDCSNCGLKKPKKKNVIDKAVGIAIKLVLLTIILTAAWEQFVKPNLSKAPVASTQVTTPAGE